MRPSTQLGDCRNLGAHRNPTGEPIFIAGGALLPEHDPLGIENPTSYARVSQAAIVAVNVARVDLHPAGYDSGDSTIVYTQRLLNSLARGRGAGGWSTWAEQGGGHDGTQGRYATHFHQLQPRHADAQGARSQPVGTAANGRDRDPPRPVCEWHAAGEVAALDAGPARLGGVRPAGLYRDLLSPLPGP